MSETLSQSPNPLTRSASTFEISKIYKFLPENLSKNCLSDPQDPELDTWSRISLSRKKKFRHFWDSCLKGARMPDPTFPKLPRINGQFRLCQYPTLAQCKSSYGEYRSSGTTCAANGQWWAAFRRAVGVDRLFGTADPICLFVSSFFDILSSSARFSRECRNLVPWLLYKPSLIHLDTVSTLFINMNR